jgi:hypothetical protein
LGERFADAELHIRDLEVAHVRECAGAADFSRNLAASGLSDSEARRRYAQVMRALAKHPGGLVGAFIGWERLASVLFGGKGADEALLFPRSGSGALLGPSSDGGGPSLG